jgi:predicted small metal-binding protein
MRIIFATGDRIGGKSGRRRSTMRALDCECGQHLEAADDAELFERAREHVDRDHPETGLDDEQVRGILAQGSYDK